MAHPALAPRRRPWKVAIPLAIVLVLFAAWSGFWVYAAGKAETLIAARFAEEAKAGRHYRCASQSIGGFPFRIAFRCTDASIELANVTPPQAMTLKELVVLAQVYDPTLLIGEFTGPFTLAEHGKPVTLVANWALARASFRGQPRAPERVSITIDEASFERPAAGANETLLKAARLELHARRDPISTADNIALELGIKLVGATAPKVSPVAADQFNADIMGVVRGLKDLRPKPLAVGLKEWQAAGGKLDVISARITQGPSVATATGTLGLSPAGRLDGSLRIMAVGLVRVLATLGLDRMAGSIAPERLSALNRLVPGLQRRGAQQPSSEDGVLAFLGQPIELEGKRGITLPLTFSDGKVTLGPIPLGQTPPLY